MKKVLLIAALAVSSVSFAQTSKSTWMLGGGAGFSSSKTGDLDPTTNLNFSPSIGYFVIDNLAIGAQIVVNSEKTGDVSTSTTAFGPSVRYYFTSLGNNAKLFGGLNIAFGSSKQDDVSVSATAFGVEAGAAFFLNQSIALEAGLGYNSLKVKDYDDPTNTIGLRVGFQIHFGK